MTKLSNNSSLYLLNPHHYLGAITVILFLIQVFTGAILFMNFIPYFTEAYQSLMYITNTLPYGFFFRTLHRYSAFGMVILSVLHMIRMFTTGRYLRPRDVGWVTGVVLLFFTLLVTVTGFLTSYDVWSQGILQGLAQMLNVGRREFNSLLLVNYGLHLLLPILIFTFLIIHFSRIARPKIFTPFPLTFIILGVMVGLSGLFPIAPLQANPEVQTADPMQIIYALAIITGFLLLSAFLPYFSRKKRAYAYVDEARCTGCMYCADACPKKAIEEKTIKRHQQFFQVANVLKRKCQGCGICVGACRSAVIQLEGQMDEILLEEVRNAWIQKTQ